LIDCANTLPDRAYEFSQQSNVDQKLIPFRDTVAEISPDSRVLIPVHLEAFADEDILHSRRM
jgi:hypothetical protein